jgi:hypothetical protein
MTSKGFQLTERDVEILQFINLFGFCEMPQLIARFGWRKPRNYQIMKKLLTAGLVKHERVFHGQHGIYRLTPAGARHSGLPPLSKVPLASYAHDVRVIELYLALRQQYPGVQWVSERELKHEKYFSGVGKRGHLSDGLLIFEDGKHVALEVELTLKSKSRLEKILKEYGAQFSIKEVWYFGTPAVATTVRELVTRLKLSFVKVFDLHESLHHESTRRLDAVN